MTEISLEKYLNDKLCGLRDSLLSRIAAAEKGLSARLEANERAVEKAERSVDLRLQGMNEFRAALSDQATHFVTRKELDIWRANIEDKMDTTQTRLDRSAGRAGGVQALLGWIVAGVALFGMLLALADRL